MKFDVNTCKTSSSTYDHIAEVVSSIPLDTVKSDLGKKFYDANEVIEFLYSVFISKGNGILHGPGGFGKSNITKEFLLYYGIQSVVKVGNSSTDVESLLGIPNIEKLTKESEYEIAFEKSVFALPGVLILEEFLDVRPTVAAALKDILSEGGYRQGNDFIHSKIGPVIICSNKTPEEVSIDLSTAAFYKERFPYSTYVCWNGFDYSDFLSFYKVLYGKEEVEKDNKYQLLSDLCSVSCNNDTIISPRIAIKVRDLFFASGNIKSLKYVPLIDYSKIEDVEYNLTERRFFENLADKIVTMKPLISNFTPITGDDYLSFVYFINQLKSQIKSSNIVGDLLLKSISELIILMDLKLKELEEFTKERGEKGLNSLEEINTLNQKICTYLNQ